MRVAIIGSRGLCIRSFASYLPENTTQIISGGAKGIDMCAKEYALSHRLQYVEFLPDYKRYGKAAPLIRNQQIITGADLVIAFWDGKSHGTKHVIELCKRANVPVQIHTLSS